MISNKAVYELEAGLEKLGIQMKTEALGQYLALLQKWNRSYNLTAIKDVETMVARHILDSLAISKWVEGSRLLDVGSGAGLPGIPLAIFQPELQVVLLDSNGKKTRFLEEVKRRLFLDNVEIVQTRVESYQPLQHFDTVTTRAFSELSQMLNWTHHLIKKNGRWLAMKGRLPQTELASITFPYQVKPYSVPGLDNECCCIIIENAIKD